MGGRDPSADATSRTKGPPIADTRITIVIWPVLPHAAANTVAGAAGAKLCATRKNAWSHRLLQLGGPWESHGGRIPWDARR